LNRNKTSKLHSKQITNNSKSHTRTEKPQANFVRQSDLAGNRS
jgi:hypothetical protein